jgi:hypothetical protein
MRLTQRTWSACTQGEKQSTRIAAIRELLDRGCGKPTRFLADFVKPQHPENGIVTPLRSEFQATLFLESAISAIRLSIWESSSAC